MFFEMHQVLQNTWFQCPCFSGGGKAAIAFLGFSTACCESTSTRTSVEKKTHLECSALACLSQACSQVAEGGSTRDESR